MAVQSVMSPTVDQSGRPETPGSFLVTTRCGPRVGMEVEVAWRRKSVMSPIVSQSSQPGTPGSFLVTRRCGLRVGMEVGVAWPFSR